MLRESPLGLVRLFLEPIQPGYVPALEPVDPPGTTSSRPPCTGLVPGQERLFGSSTSKCQERLDRPGQARNISRTQQATELQQTPLRSVTKTQQKQEQDISGTGQHISKLERLKVCKIYSICSKLYSMWLLHPAQHHPSTHSLSTAAKAGRHGQKTKEHTMLITYGVLVVLWELQITVVVAFRRCEEVGEIQ